MVYLLLFVTVNILNLNSNSNFINYYYNFVTITIHNVGWHTAHGKRTYVDFSLHFVAVCLVKRLNDGVVS
jgi:hypothetical protein